ncbi:sugar ABC transporter permease [Clostridium sp. 19966]|uniref:ABC transporter permease n=1 Tax=Clostridium sp. 19966 TaxID=2768166 RepID=UPI0028DD6C69|nr:ABC transporter permease subunit [Clostridium sp. 19966]MDT8715665.1 sugar ABC transporter permease [Clostridium sp. 19966]
MLQVNKKVRIDSFGTRVKKDFKKNKELYLLVLPVVLFYLVFCYKPMYGVIIAFKDFNPSKGILGSNWIGFKYFTDFFSSYYFVRLMKNTLIISVTSLILGFPAPILLALLINELRVKWFSRIVQTITYIPHFVSLIVVCGMIVDFSQIGGVLSSIVEFFIGKQVNLLSVPSYFVPLYVSTNIWKEIGFSSIIYIAALMGIDQQLYEAAQIDGANKWKQLLHVTLPGIAPMIIIMFILAMGGLLNVGYEKIILLYNPMIYSTSDVISTFVYRRGLLENNFGYSTAVGLFNSIINFILIYATNKISRKVNDTSLW